MLKMPFTPKAHYQPAGFKENSWAGFKKKRWTREYMTNIVLGYLITNQFMFSRYADKIKLIVNYDRAYICHQPKVVGR